MGIDKIQSYKSRLRLYIEILNSHDHQAHFTEMLEGQVRKMSSGVMEILHTGDLPTIRVSDMRMENELVDNLLGCLYMTISQQTQLKAIKDEIKFKGYQISNSNDFINQMDSSNLKNELRGFDTESWIISPYNNFLENIDVVHKIVTSDKFCHRQQKILKDNLGFFNELKSQGRETHDNATRKKLDEIIRKITRDM